MPAIVSKECPKCTSKDFSYIFNIFHCNTCEFNWYTDEKGVVKK